MDEIDINDKIGSRPKKPLTNDGEPINRTLKSIKPIITGKPKFKDGKLTGTTHEQPIPKDYDIKHGNHIVKQQPRQDMIEPLVEDEDGFLVKNENKTAEKEECIHCGSKNPPKKLKKPSKTNKNEDKLKYQRNYYKNKAKELFPGIKNYLEKNGNKPTDVIHLHENIHESRLATYQNVVTWLTKWNLIKFIKKGNRHYYYLPNLPLPAQIKEQEETKHYNTEYVSTHLKKGLEFLPAISRLLSKSKAEGLSPKELYHQYKLAKANPVGYNYFRDILNVLSHNGDLLKTGHGKNIKYLLNNNASQQKMNLTKNNNVSKTAEENYMKAKIKISIPKNQLNELIYQQVKEKLPTIDSGWEEKTIYLTSNKDDEKISFEEITEITIECEVEI